MIGDVVVKEKEKTWQLTRKVYRFNVRVTAPIYDAVLSFLDLGVYLNISEFINDLFQQHFKEKGIDLRALPVNNEDKEGKASINDVIVDTLIVIARLPVPMKNAVNQVLDSGVYFNISHYIRDTIKKDLEARDILVR